MIGMEHPKLPTCTSDPPTQLWIYKVDEDVGCVIGANWVALLTDCELF